jgi:PAS domain S-box-containing protein
VYDREIIVERPDGLRKNIKPHPEPIYDTDGNIIGAVNLLLDITERKIAEAQSAKLAAIIQSSEDAIVGKNLNSIVTSWNPGAEKLFGYAPEEMIGQPITRLIPPDRLNEEPAIISRLRNGETVDHFDTKRLTKDGRLIDISLTISPIRDKNGKIIGASKIARDITAQKKLNDALRESEERLRMATEATELGTWEFYPLTKRLIWSDECKKIYGVPPDFEPGVESVYEHVHPEEREYVQRETDRILNLDKEGNLNIIYRIIRENDKQLRWLKVQGKAFFNDQQQPERYIGTMLDITDDKLAEQLLKENEERLRMAIDSTRLGTWEYHPLTQEISCSDECRKIFGVAEDIKPDNDFVFEHTHPDDREFVKQEIKKAIDPDGAGSCEIEYRILRASDHETRWVKVQGKAFFNNQRQPERFIGTMLDITEDRRQQEELRESVELFQTMADNVPAMIWMSGTDKFDDYFNKTWLEFTGRTLEQECDEGWLEGLHPSDIQTCIDTYNASFKDQKGFYLEYRLRRYDGQYRWIADKSVPRYSAEGEFLGFISACIDIDDQKRFREKIQDSELLFKTISNASPAGLWLTDEDGQNVFVNDTWINWTGKPLEQQLVEGWIGTINNEDIEPVTNKFRQSFKQRKYFNTEFRFRKTGGEERWGLAEGYPYYDINGSFAGYAGSITDITELKKLEQRKDDFIKMASHELKTPITSISGYVQLLLNIYNELDNERLQASKPTVKSSLNTISKQVAKLTRLISELLDLSKIESGKLELHKTEFSLADLVEETVQDVRHTTAKHAIIVNSDFEGKIYADKDRISQVILNLLTNAVKYSPDSDSIEVSLEGNKKLTTIQIRDYGIGIDKKDHQKIFERFYRVEGRSEQTYPGFGIGLFIASEIIHRHYGTISVESEKGKGSLFTVTLPVGIAGE